MGNKIATNEIKVGTAFMCGSEPLIVQKKLGQKGGRQGITVNLRVKNIVTGSTKDLGVDAGDKFDEIELEKKAVKLSYVDGEDYHFMDENYEDVVLTKEDLGDNAGYLLSRSHILRGKGCRCRPSNQNHTQNHLLRAWNQGRHFWKVVEACHIGHRNRSDGSAVLQH